MLIAAAHSAPPAGAAANSAPPARAAAPEVADREAKPRRETDSAQRTRANSTPASQGSPQYRLVYDKELSRTFVQVVDRDSGEEILRFPPEELVRFINNTIERNQARGTTGLLVDRSV